ncbi:hypothetical protein [Roseomonas haemaphysalidis]|uniref:Uncharacterized protein n=1 Tax=Roseomonas haemaphysalidis TaxID=2768162 RepID=A0ABS3KP12_9PROT|nr:hypothetical protein [Roseomonas haemaphysalidis]MBO1078096.1 hypothetical protein [Roseomonas haemaphysalidis]
MCSTYAGTGGLEGDANLAGKARPLMLGVKRNLAPQPLLAASLVWQIGGGPLAEVGGVRDRGIGLAGTSDYPTLAALLAASVPAGRFATCLTQGLIKLGSPPAGQVTVDARSPGDTSHAAIALALLRGPGGLSDDRINSANFGALVPGVAGFLWAGGTVTQALNDVVTAGAGWWGSDRLGRITAGRLLPPDAVATQVTFERWMLTAEPSEMAGTAPRWRQRVAYRALGVTQTATDLAGLVASDPGLVAYFGAAYQLATAFDTAISAAYPSAVDPAPLITGLDSEGDAAAVATQLLALHGVRRRRWRVRVGKWGNLVDLGNIVAVDHPKLADRNWIVVAADEAGDDKTLTLWG